MLERYFVRPETLDRIRSSWLGSPVEQYATWMLERGYAVRNLGDRVPMLLHFGTFAQKEGAQRYAELPGYIDAFCERLREAQATLPEPARDEAPVLFSAHGLPESYIERGDPYLDDIRITVATVTRRLGLGPRAQLCFQSRLGRRKWLGPYTEQAIERLAEAGHTALVICPVAFTGEHIETLQEIDILYRERAAALGITHFARARTVGCHPAFIDALAALAVAAASERGWVR